LVVVSGFAFHGFTLFLQVTWDYEFEAPSWGVLAGVALFDHEQNLACNLSYGSLHLLQAVFGFADAFGGAFQGRFYSLHGV